jgi:hypothetical protein
MNDNANGAHTDDLVDGPKMNNVLSRLGSLGERSRIKNTRPVIQQTAQPHVALPTTSIEKEPVIEQEIVPEVSAERVVSASNMSKAKSLAEEVIPDVPLRLKGTTVFTPENMYEQVRNDYMGIIHQSINGALDNLASFYIQGKRFEASKDMKVFLIKSLEKNIEQLKVQYIAKYPLINGLQSMILDVERKEAAAFKRMVQEFLTRMLGNTFS